MKAKEELESIVERVKYISQYSKDAYDRDFFSDVYNDLNKYLEKYQEVKQWKQV